MNLRPLDDRMVVRRIKAEEKSPGGIIIPDIAKDKPTEAEVIAVGPGRRLDDGSRRAPEVSAGQRVLFGKYQGSEVKFGGEEYVVLREDDVLGVIED